MVCEVTRQSWDRLHNYGAQFDMIDEGFPRRQCLVLGAHQGVQELGGNWRVMGETGDVDGRN